MILTLIALWFPYEQTRDAVSKYLMIAALFIIGQCQGYVQGWFQTGIANMVHVMTPNTQERAKIISITSIIYSAAPTVLNVYVPLMVDILPINANKFTMTFYRGTYTPLVLFAPLALIAFYGTKERLVLPKSRTNGMSFGNSVRSVIVNRIFWIKCFDAWNDFLEGAKGDVWDMLVYRAHIMKSTTYGILNTFCHNSQLWAMMFSPWFIKKFGKKKIKIFKNVLQIFLIAAVGLTYKSRFAVPFLFLINYINRFVDCPIVIDNAIESDMRDTQQYLVGERIDGSFGLVSTYANGFVGMATGLFLPWIYKKCGFDGNDYTVLDAYVDFNPDLPLNRQKKNPDCVLYNMLDVLIAVSVFGAAVDVIPWFFYNVSETGQRSMIRVIRVRTMIEDYKSGKGDVENFIEGCEAIFKAREYENARKLEPPKEEIRRAKLAPGNSSEERSERKRKLRELRKKRDEIEIHNEEIEIARFVLFEIRRFSTEFGKKQLELAKLIADAGSERFYEVYERAAELARGLPRGEAKEERVWRRMEIRNCASLKKSLKLAYKYYPDGKIFFDRAAADDAYDLPDETKRERKIRRKAIKKANRERNVYVRAAAPYIVAERTVKLAAGYEKIDEILSGYDEAKRAADKRRADENAELKNLARERELDMERKRAQKKIMKR